VLVRDAGVRIPLRAGQYGWSSQFTELVSLAALLGARYVASGPAQAYVEARDEFLGLMAAWQPRFTGLLAGMVQPASVGGNLPDYTGFLALDELLSLQEGVKADWTPKGQDPIALAPAEFVSPDELMFIIVHQAFELWFKAILQELDGAMAALLAAEPDVPEAARHIRRVVRMQRLLVEQIHIPATMLPLDFFRFRSQSREVEGVTYVRGLTPSSGTESYQFREIEIVAGLKGDEAHGEMLQGRPDLPVRFLTPAQERRLAEPSLPEAFEKLLAQRGIGDVAEIFAPADTPNPHADLADLADALLEFDEFFRLWRVNHATMVQVMIGERSGTGFLGPEYLRETAGMGQQAEGRVFARSQTRPRFFEALWSARTKLKAG
jgi:tryptophan 2,3-dioxygenase